MKQKIVKIILSFFIVMICCTLIARGAASMTVAKVKTEGTSRGSLVDEFTGEGTIQAKDKVYQSLPEGQILGMPYMQAMGSCSLTWAFWKKSLRSRPRRLKN